MIRGASNKIWSKNTVELGDVSNRATFYYLHYNYKTYSGCLKFGWTDIAIDDEAYTGESEEDEVTTKDGSKSIT